jgi:hypothetical protein
MILLHPLLLLIRPMSHPHALSGPFTSCCASPPSPSTNPHACDNRPQNLSQTGVMTHLAWNCRGSGGNLRSSTMTHLARLLHSTKAQVCFLSETRNSSITTTTIRNRFNYNEAFVVPAQCQPGGLWLL